MKSRGKMRHAVSAQMRGVRELHRVSPKFFQLLTLYCLFSSIAPYVTISPIASPRASSATRSPYFMQAILSKGGPTMNWLQMRAASIAGSGPRRRSIIRKPQPGRRSRKTTNEPRADGACDQRDFHGQLTMP